MCGKVLNSSCKFSWKRSWRNIWRIHIFICNERKIFIDYTHSRYLIVILMLQVMRVICYLRLFLWFGFSFLDIYKKVLQWKFYHLMINKALRFLKYNFNFFKLKIHNIEKWQRDWIRIPQIASNEHDIGFLMTMKNIRAFMSNIFVDSILWILLGKGKMFIFLK